MSDLDALVERLRNPMYFAGTEDPEFSEDAAIKDMREAADAIERLRFALRPFVRFNVSGYHNMTDMAGDYAALKRVARRALGESNG